MSSFDSVDSAFRFFHEDEDIRVVMDEAIGEIKECLYVNREEIDGVWSNYWHDPADDAFMAQMVACLVLRRRLSNGPKHAYVRAPPEKAGDSQKSQFFSRLQEQVLVAMCGLMSRQYGKFLLSGKAPNAIGGHWKLSEKLTIAALSIELAIKNRPDVHGFELCISRVADDYEGFIDVYLRELQSPSLPFLTTERPKAGAAEHLIGTSALIARVSTYSDLAALDIPFVPSLISKHQGETQYLRPSQPTTKSSRRSGLDVKFSAKEAWLGPSLARSYTSSMSSGYRSFKAAVKERESLSSVHRSRLPPVPSVNWSDFMSPPSMLTASIPSDTAMHYFEPHAEDEDMTL
ncbi:uncharacterized protein PV07_06928 [Cladophialophora immunda]|uniref:Uncharacterized protein n=1 Tax=Cladophialophora immunda TaxID=569365 RepID=A0A0D2APW2_9EURO|nr:uncharacterized protein PV07_06928 [Cladophialophora immunda]KIW27162.1 hypothetical protein PV07_06928 [Cladophialophora immunda]